MRLECKDDEEKVKFYNKKFIEDGEFLPYGDTF